MDWIFVGRPKAGGREYYHQLLAIEAPSIWGMLLEVFPMLFHVWWGL